MLPAPETVYLRLCKPRELPTKQRFFLITGARDLGTI